MIQSWTLGIQDSGQLQGGCTLSIIVESDVLMRDRKLRVLFHCFINNTIKWAIYVIDSKIQGFQFHVKLS